MRSSLRDDFRHLCVQYIGEKMEDRELWQETEKAIFAYLGVIGAYESGAKIEEVMGENMIIRCKSGHEKKVCACLALINNFGGKRVRLRVKRISGTISSLCKKEGIERIIGKKNAGRRRATGQIKNK